MTSQGDAGASPRTELALLLGLVVLTVAAYASALRTPFQFDDRPLAEALAKGTPPALGGLRPVLKATYALSGALSPRPWSFHLGNLGIHLVNVGLVVVLARRLGFRPLPTFGSASFFALHPIHTEAVTYVSGRSAALSTSFVLLALLGHVRIRWLGVSLVRELACVAMVALAVLTKEQGLVVPLAFLLWDRTVARELAPRPWRRYAAWALFGIGALLFFVGHPAYFKLLYSAVGQRTFLDAVAHQLAATTYGMSRVLMLGRPCIDPGLWAPPSRAAVIAGGMVVATLLALGVRQARRRPLLSFASCWFLLFGVFPYVLISRADVLNERHLYSANLGSALIVGIGLSALESWSKLRRLPLVAPLVFAITVTLFVQTVRRNAEYESEVSLWESTTREAPHNARAFSNLGVAYEHDGRIPSAIRCYMTALELEPGYIVPKEHLLRLHRRSAAPSGTGDRDAR